MSDGTTSAAFSAASGSIAGTAGVAFNVSDSNVTIGYSGAITKATDGRLVDFSNFDTDTATLSGNLSCTALCDGIEVTNNGGAGTVTFSGGTKTLNTSAGAVTAVNLDTNTGGTVNFTVGGLDIDTSTATAFSVVGGGTVTVSGIGNAINTTSGTAFLNTGGDNINAAIAVNAALTTTTGRLVDIQNRTNTGPANVVLSGNLSTNGGTGILVANNTGATIAFGGTTKTLNTAGNTAVTLTNNNGAIVDFIGGGLDIDTTTGTGFSAVYTSSGTVNVTGTGNSINSTGGQAISAGATTAGQALTANITFDSVTSGGGLSNIELTRVNGTVTMNGGALSGATSQAVDIDTGTASITYAGTFNSTRGIFVANKTGGTVTFSGGTKTLNTGANAAVSLTSNGGTTINFTGGGLDIDTTGGGGFVATGGGAINVTGSNNRLTTMSGTALALSGGTTIGSGALTFRDIAANGAVNAIVLNGTGSNGLTVTGDGTLARNASGGTIQNTTDDAIALTNASNVTLQSMSLINNGDTAPATLAAAEDTTGEHTVQISGGSNVVLSGVLIQNPTGSGMVVLNLGGTNRINNDSLFTGLTDGQRHGLFVSNTNTNMTLFEFRNSAMKDSLNDASMFFFANNGTSNMTLDVKGSTFENLDVQALTVAAGGLTATTGTLTSTVGGPNPADRNFFQNAHSFVIGGSIPVTAENNLGVLVNNGATHISTVAEQSFRQHRGRGPNCQHQHRAHTEQRRCDDRDGHGEHDSEHRLRGGRRRAARHRSHLRTRVVQRRKFVDAVVHEQRDQQRDLHGDEPRGVLRRLPPHGLGRRSHDSGQHHQHADRRLPAGDRAAVQADECQLRQRAGPRQRRHAQHGRELPRRRCRGWCQRAADDRRQQQPQQHQRHARADDCGGDRGSGPAGRPAVDVREHHWQYPAERRWHHHARRNSRHDERHTGQCRGHGGGERDPRGQCHREWHSGVWPTGVHDSIEVKHTGETPGKGGWMAEPFLSEIRIMSFVFAPKGWALCNGQLLPINQNQALFSLLGTTFGGDGRVNFALPDLRARTPIHVGSGHTLGRTRR